MKKQDFDVDIDITSVVDHEDYGVPAMRYDETKQEIQQHPSGIYLDPDIPIDPETGLCALSYKDAPEYDFFKIDLLNNNAYSIFTQAGKNKKDLLDTYHQDVDWSKFTKDHYLSRLPHVSKHKELIRKVQPQSIHDLADILALIRPGKKHLIESYCNGDREKVRAKLYLRPSDNSMYFKKSHSYAYAAMVICVFNEMCNQD